MSHIPVLADVGDRVGLASQLSEASCTWASRLHGFPYFSLSVLIRGTHWPGISEAFTGADPGVWMKRRYEQYLSWGCEVVHLREWFLLQTR